MRTIKISQLIEMQNIANNITCTPYEDKHIVKIFLKEKTKKGICKVKTVIAKIKEDVIIPEISNWTVKHLGYNTYKHLVNKDFYINLYYR